MNLYELNEKLDWLETIELDEEVLTDTIEAIIEDAGMEELLNNMAWANENDKATVELCKQEKDKLSAKQDVAKKRIEKRNAIVFEILSKLKNRKLKTGLYNFWIQKNPKKTVYEDDKIPNEYFKEVKELDKQKIKHALDEGLDIPGVTITQSEGVRFR